MDSWQHRERGPSRRCTHVSSPNLREMTTSSALTVSWTLQTPSASRSCRNWGLDVDAPSVSYACSAARAAASSPSAGVSGDSSGASGRYNGEGREEEWEEEWERGGEGDDRGPRLALSSSQRLEPVIWARLREQQSTSPSPVDITHSHQSQRRGGRRGTRAQRRRAPRAQSAQHGRRGGQGGERGGTLSLCWCWGWGCGRRSGREG